jgi:threonine dehydratase
VDRAAVLAAHLTEIEAAERRLAGRVAPSPLLAPTTLAGLWLKAECLQPTGSFKIRGAFNAVTRLAGADPPPTGLAAVSSGNHAQAVALAGRAVGLPVVVVMPESAAPVKVAATRRLGADVVTAGVTTENRETRFREVVAETGYTPVHPFDDWDVLHGQGTIGLELARELPDLDTVVVPVSGGGLISGIALALAARAPAARVVGVEPAVADDARRSLAAGRVVRRAAGRTLADGARASSLGARSAEVLLEQRLVTEIVTVDDEQLRLVLPRLWLEAKLLVEPTGALAAAAVLAGTVRGRGGPVVAVLSGGNVDPALLVELLGEQPARPAAPRLESTPR